MTGRQAAAAHLRELEGMTYTEYLDYSYANRRRLLAECDGGSLAHLPDDAKARLMACPIPTHEEAIAEAVAAIEKGISGGDRAGEAQGNRGKANRKTVIKQ